MWKNEVEVQLNIYFMKLSTVFVCHRIEKKTVIYTMTSITVRGNF
jgi:hypothetical protein